MPGKDGTGPLGSGSMTGGGRGYCNPQNAGAVNIPFGIGRGGFPRGCGNGRNSGGGRGIMRRQAAFNNNAANISQTNTTNTMKTDLSNRIIELKQQLTALEKQFSDINEQTSEK